MTDPTATYTMLVTIAVLAATLATMPPLYLSAARRTRRRIAQRLNAQGYSRSQVANMIGVSREEVCRLLGLAY